MNHIQILKELEACEEAVEWADGYESLEHAWNECKRSDWMLWLDCKMGLFNDQQRRLMACRFVRETPISEGKTVWDLLTDERSRNAVIVAERFANSEATEEELDAAWAAARDAARAAAWDASRAAAWAARDAARAAAWAARDAASEAASAASRDAARDATWDATWDAAWAAAWAAAWDAARDAARAAQCDIIRSYGNPFNINNKKGE